MSFLFINLFIHRGSRLPVLLTDRFLYSAFAFIASRRVIMSGVQIEPAKQFTVSNWIQNHRDKNRFRIGIEIGTTGLKV